MKPSPFEYHAPRSLEEAIGLLASLDNAKVLAGGQSLVPMLALRYAMPDHVVDLRLIGGLADVREDAGEVAVGCMTRQRDLERDPTVRRRLPLLPAALRWVGHLQTRSRGTIGGSLCHLDPAAELPAVAMALDAELEIAGPEGLRRLPMAEFPAFYMTPAIGPDEVLTAIRFRPWTPGHRFGFVEFARRHGDFAIVGAIALIEADARGAVSRASLTLFGVGPAPLRLPAAEAALVGRPLDAAAREDAAALAREIDAMEDAFVSADYRRHLAGVLMRRTLEQAAGLPASRAHAAPGRAA